MNNAARCDLHLCTLRLPSPHATIAIAAPCDLHPRTLR